MGQAFDRDGNVLGEAFGDTKAAVLKKLESEFKDKAAEIRIKSLERDAMPPEPMEQFFAFAHLPPHLQDVSRGFGELATRIVQTLPRNPERTVALRKLLEAKDCAVRALLFK